jgi:hypothetical protein
MCDLCAELLPASWTCYRHPGDPAAEPASSAPGVAAGLVKYGFTLQTITTLVAPPRAAQASTKDHTLLLYKVVYDTTGVEAELCDAVVRTKATDALARYKAQTKKTLLEEIAYLEAKLNTAKQSLADLDTTDTTPAPGAKRSVPDDDSEEPAPKVHKSQTLPPAPEPLVQAQAQTEVPVVVSDGEQQQQQQAPGVEDNTVEEEEQAVAATPVHQDQHFVYNTRTLTKSAVLCAVARQLTGSPGAIIDMVLLLTELGLPPSAGHPLRVWYSTITGTHLSSPLSIQAAAE